MTPIDYRVLASSKCEQYIEQNTPSDRDLCIDDLRWAFKIAYLEGREDQLRDNKLHLDQLLNSCESPKIETIKPTLSP